MGSHLTAEAVIAALVETKGLVASAARKLGCKRQTIYNWAKRNKQVRETIDAQRAQFVDAAELALMTAVAKGEPWAVKFTLSTLGKDRGYVQRQEQTDKNGHAGADGDPITVLILPDNGRDRPAEDNE